MNRRKFLSAMGLASGSLFLPSLGGAFAATPPKRLFVYFTQHGTWNDGWKMRQPGLPEDRRWEFDLRGVAERDFSDALRPLYAHRNRMVVVDGLGLVSAEADGSGLRHEVAYVHALTGANEALAVGLPLGSAANIDQRIAEKIGRPDRYRSLELSVSEVPPQVIFRGPKLVLPPESNPHRLYEKLFGGNTNAVPLSARARMLERVKGRYASLSKRLSGADRQKLELHRDLVSELRHRVGGLASATCDAPGELNPDRTYANDFAAMVPQIATAFACDLTRVISLNMGQLDLEMINGEAGDLHNDYAHNLYVSREAQTVMTQYTAVHARQFAEILSTFDSIPEGDGTLLDNTLCLWVSEVANGAHSFDQWPAIIAGGKAFRMGRYMHFPRTTPFQGWGWDGPIPSMGLPHQHLLTSVCQGMGLDVNHMPVKEIRGLRGARIDCTGPLPGLA